MRYNPNIHHRKSIRLKGYDYSQAGMYFITLCVQHRLSLFGEIIQDQMALNAAGEMIEKQWLALPDRFPHIDLREYIVMPNHFHAILSLHPQNVGTPLTASNITKPISGIIGAFKSLTTVEYIRGVKTFNWQDFAGSLWQRNYWEHVIRNEESCNDIAQYIINNPLTWEKDELRLAKQNPAN